MILSGNRVAGLYNCNSSKKKSDMMDFVNPVDFANSADYDTTSITSTQTVSPSASAYAGVEYTFEFPENQIYENLRLKLGWGAFTEDAGTDTITTSCAVERMEVWFGSSKIQTLRFDDFALAFKTSKDETKRKMRSLNNFRAKLTGTQAAFTQVLPLLYWRNYGYSLDVRSSSTAIPVPGGMGALQIKITMRNPHVITGAGASPTLTSLECKADKRDYKNPDMKNNAIKEVIGSNIPFMVYDNTVIPQVAATTSGTGTVSSVSFNLNSLEESNVQAMVLKARLATDTSGMNAVSFAWSSTSSGVYENGSLIRTIRADDDIDVSMLNCSHIPYSNASGQWTDYEKIISANTAPISEIEKFIPNYHRSGSTPRLFIESISGLSNSTAYVFELHVIRILGISLKNGRI